MSIAHHMDFDVEEDKELSEVANEIFVSLMDTGEIENVPDLDEEVLDKQTVRDYKLRVWDTSEKLSIPMFEEALEFAESLDRDIDIKSISIRRDIIGIINIHVIIIPKKASKLAKVGLRDQDIEKIELGDGSLYDENPETPELMLQAVKKVRGVKYNCYFEIVPEAYEEIRED